MAPRYKLRLSKLDFVSAVDVPAQSTATVAIIKRDAGDEISALCRVAKVDDELGIVMGWAFTSTVDGEPYFDLQGDAISENEIVKVAADFLAAGGFSDEMHDGEPDGRVVFCWPLTSEIAKAFSIECDKTGLLVGIRPSPAVLEKFKSGEYAGFSIGGLGEREVAKQMKCAKCAGYMAKDAAFCPSCKAPAAKRAPVGKATWTTAYVDDLPDSAFLYVEAGGPKDSDGKTTPRSLRHFPYKDVNGKIDIAHLRDATGRIPQSSLPASLKEKLQQKAEKLLAAQHADKRAPRAVAKHAYLTSSTDGHAHILDHDNGQASGETDYRPLGDGLYHSHPWVLSDDGIFLLGDAAGHTHTVPSRDALNALAAAQGDDLASADVTSVAKSHEEQVMPPVTDPKIEKLTKDPAKFLKKLEDAEAEIERLKKKYTMTDAQREVYKALARDEDKAAFLEKSHAERDADVKKALEADPVVVELDGVQYRKSAGEATIALAKRSKEQAEALAKREAELEHERLMKRVGDELRYLPGDTLDKAALLKAALGIADQKQRDAALAILKAHNAGMAGAFGTIGVVEKDGNGSTLQQQLDSLAKRHQEAQKALGKTVDDKAAMGAVLLTPEGRDLYNRIELAKRATPTPN